MMENNNNTKGKTRVIKKRRRRRNNIIKVAIGMVVLLVLLTVVIGFIIGKKTFRTSESAVYVNKNDQILCASIEKLDKEYYKSEDLKQFVENQITTFNSESGDKVIKLSSFKEDGKTVKLFLRYENSKVYEKFNGQEFFVGTLKEAKAKGYEIPKKAPTGDNLKIVIMQEKIGVKVDGEIVYTSANVKKINSSTVTMKDKDEQETDFIMVIYK